MAGVFYVESLHLEPVVNVLLSQCRLFLSTFQCVMEHKEALRNLGCGKVTGYFTDISLEQTNIWPTSK